MTYCSEMVPSLKRALAPPGQFETLFPTATDDELALTIADAFSYLQLFGMLTEWTLDSLLLLIEPDLPAPEQQAVVTVAAMRTIRTQLSNNKSKVVYEAGPVRYQTEIAATVLTAELQLLMGVWEELKDALVADTSGSGTSTWTFDNYYERQYAEFYERYPVGVE